MRLRHLCFFLLLFCSSNAFSQQSAEIARVEFNSGTRAYREQLIVTKDSLSVIKEDFREDDRPQIIRRPTTAREWKSVLSSLSKVRLSEIDNLESPTKNREVDAAAHGSIIITSSDGQSYTHGFDDENPHKSFHDLMSCIRKLRNE